MRAVAPHEAGAGSSPRLIDLPEPSPSPDELLIAVRATAVNHADLLQLRGRYPPPDGESPIPGLECAGEVVAVGGKVKGWREGDRAMALLAGGGHAELAAVPRGQAMRVPKTWTWAQAAALPEAALTAWTNLVVEGGLKEGESVLLTGATGGVGTFAVQLARELGARVLVAGRDHARLDALLELGAAATVELAAELPAQVRAANGGRGVDLVLELVGGPGIGDRLETLEPQGRLVLVGLLAGAHAEIALDNVLRHRLRVIGSVLRARTREEKAGLVAGFWEFAEERLADGRLRPVVDRTFPFDEIADAYASLERGGARGKLVVELAER